MSEIEYQFDIQHPEWYYFKLELIVDPAIVQNRSNPDNTTPSVVLDHLTWKTYLLSALKRFHGLVGESIPVDILQLIETPGTPSCIIRTPWDGKQKVATSITGFTTSMSGVVGLEDYHKGSLRISAQSDFLVGVTGPGRI
ncbi:hypothetical protein BABINDRAFT_103990 [Babjeviella inositovora NRRL Y-12698]|uniref:Ribonucleases P/MRP subunit Pop8-like domain-containing protein n=1 Tax=Babjeviella inositovora NRRL Y-12698 TaxID=984486 RepID=A0A1E3QHT2_9ASCO|nr:uncharacterized protein BABINDRAFT_103990 [Babjeviella inositovora NRRL Y-12698]ODQ77251.1 hypothetical protein BABINDRAFT_103990 [Babjeviella inositovora NRRL Y-12698]